MLKRLGPRTCSRVYDERNNKTAKTTERMDTYAVKNNACKSPKAPIMEPTRQVVQPLERIAVDITGPWSDTERGNSYIMVALDYFLKHVECYPLLNQRAQTVAKHHVYGNVTDLWSSGKSAF